MGVHDNLPAARILARDAVALPHGVRFVPLKTFTDPRGSFTEVFRHEWELGARPLQWNIVHSQANVLRGVHAHRTHTDYLTMAAGEMILGLCDLRPEALPRTRAMLVRLSADDLHLAVIPAGVAHGFYFPRPACHVYAVTHYFDATDEFGCHWADPELNLPFPCSEPLLSARDGAAGSLQSMIEALGLARAAP